MLDEDEARRLVEEAIERAGGARFIVGNPRHPFALKSTLPRLRSLTPGCLRFAKMN